MSAISRKSLLGYVRVELIFTRVGLLLAGTELVSGALMSVPLRLA